MPTGIAASTAVVIDNPLPPSWLGRLDAPSPAPSWAKVGNLSTEQMFCLLSQIGYDLSEWDYKKIGDQNQCGRYQISTQMLEAYGLLASGSTMAYGIDAVNYKHCWAPIYTISNTYSNYQNYFFNTKSLSSFLDTSIAQDFLAYQRLVDLYLDAKQSNVILETDTPEMIAGMMYVSWTLGVGQSSTTANYTGTGAWAWRYYNLGDAGNSYNSGRYAVTTLAQNLPV
jgi:hypothetical protein